MSPQPKKQPLITCEACGTPNESSNTRCVSCGRPI